MTTQATAFNPMQSRIEFPTAARVTDAAHIMQVPVISTRHITAADGAQLALNDPRDSLAVVEGGRGHIITWDLCKPDFIDSPEDFADDFPPDLFSPEFRAVVCAFARLGYCYLRIDADGAEVEGLPVFDW